MGQPAQMSHPLAGAGKTKEWTWFLMQVLSFPVFQGDDSSGFPLRKTEK
jgi:hypothetical protein